MSNTGPKHVKKYHEGERINNSFTLIKEIDKEVIWGGKVKHLYMWECKCDCGETFIVRQQNVYKRIGCNKCTASKRNTQKSLDKFGYVNRGIKNRIYKDYKHSAEKRNLKFELTLDDFIKLSESNCKYCGSEPSIYPGDIKWERYTC